MSASGPGGVSARTPRQQGRHHSQADTPLGQTLQADTLGTHLQADTPWAHAPPEQTPP